MSSLSEGTARKPSQRHGGDSVCYVGYARLTLLYSLCGVADTQLLALRRLVLPCRDDFNVVLITKSTKRRHIGRFCIYEKRIFCYVFRRLTHIDSIYTHTLSSSICLLSGSDVSVSAARLARGVSKKNPCTA